MQTVTRLFDFPYYQLEKYPLEKSLVTKSDGTWIATSTKEYIDKANAISRALLRMGFKPNDKIAVISMTNRTEWNIVDIGILQIGAQNVPIYPTIAEEDYEYILNHSEAKICFVSCEEVFEKVKAIQSKVKNLKDVFSFDQLSDCKNWSEVLEMGADTSNQEEVEKLKESVTPDDLATLIYTSGTTGRPKGVMLSHNNIVSNVLCSQPRVPFETEGVALSFLPVCHIFERMILYLYQYCGVEIHFAEGLDKISDNIKEVKPTVMTVVPRLLEKVYDAIIAKGALLTGIKKKLFFWAVEVGLKFEPYGANGWWYEQKLGLARKLIFSKWKEGLGGNLSVMVSGSAALQPRLARVFAAADMPVMEGYGLTETSPVIAVNDQRNKGWKIGTVGKMIDEVEVKIAEDGEILCKGPNVMMGYYKDPEKTAEVMTGAYFHTGDIGEIDAEGFLRITDRKKEMFKTSGGKYVAPQLLENRFKQSRFIEQIMVVGEGEKMPAALIQPNFEFVKEWAKRHKIDLGSNEELVKNEKVIARMQEEVDWANQEFAKWEKVKQFRLTPDVWSVEDGHLTPTMKLKRKPVKEMYLDLYNDIYGH
ncbi:MAG TPA: long-chain fatty acid--CoA ligase [Muricauda sp.]|uniref:Long-chain fatty acid--CoA ligase n=1 Tax=Flagellimonas aurea TaxID=2915619 RepID=A0ABS3G4U7_9FLAO|nr:AMP-dependent synthetase/ligase [Allomuricauda aurea]MBC73487.1 long-chain fatty acid--CoA ligase [Allomuricauda sp.]MBO0354122.1 long-chain fatty acid--CoA ligase [Allomuricauda aurea]HBU79790.1 long-chain fatty acid--CoA ligase [Allomuricauda sp.]|tara:strand:- start:632 stop:2401 length:1770 start_codon:yes stop_codon:yes gene_type:complete